ncbi:hypothetical protein ACIQWV_39295 [Streptomyces sp. NPDC098085]|uniref:hypothetical protein n=1 Tax=Streptomyces sp. NPDC098085 TaxID=3366094 RepID=UPI00381CC65D
MPTRAVISSQLCWTSSWRTKNRNSRLPAAWPHSFGTVHSRGAVPTPTTLLTSSRWFVVRPRPPLAVPMPGVIDTFTLGAACTSTYSTEGEGAQATGAGQPRGVWSRAGTTRPVPALGCADRTVTGTETAR